MINLLSNNQLIQPGLNQDNTTSIFLNKRFSKSMGKLHNLESNEKSIYYKFIFKAKAVKKIHTFMYSQPGLKERLDFSSSKFLGRGGYGIVKSCRLTDEHGHINNIAIKTTQATCPIELSLLPFIDGIHASLIIDEINSLITMKDENNIVKILGVFQEDTGSIFNYNIVMECADTTLDVYKKKIYNNKKKLSAQNIAFICRELLLGIIACLKYNIFHTDIKLNNLLVFFNQSKIKLCDFGLIEQVDSSSRMLFNILLNTIDISFANYSLQLKYLTDVEELTYKQYSEIKGESITDASDFKVYQKLYIEVLSRYLEGDKKLATIMSKPLILLSYEGRYLVNKLIPPSPCELVDILEKEFNLDPFPR